MKKTAFFFVALLALLPLALQAQDEGSLGRFEWAKGFYSKVPPGIQGSVTDSAGNLYILAYFDNQSRWNDEAILPMVPYGYGLNGWNTLIAKISPEGEMLWKKVIHSNNNGGTQNLDIRKIGDTAFACLLNFTVPSYLDNYTYYLDTFLVADWSDYPVDGRHMDSHMWTALITFNFDGEVLEQHFLQTSYVDNDGNDIVRYYPPDTLPWNQTLFLRNATFDIDGEGNIYLCRLVEDRIDDDHDLHLGSISKVKFWVDNRVVGVCDADSRSNGHLYFNSQLLKFSPHFDTLLDSRYVVQRSICPDSTDCPMYNKIYVDRNSDVYLRINIHSHSEGTDLVFDSVKNLRLHYGSELVTRGILLKYDSSFNSRWLLNLRDSVINPSLVSIMKFHEIGFDYDSNLMFLTTDCFRGVNDDTVNFYSELFYNDVHIDVKNDAVVFAFTYNDSKPQLRSYGSIPSINYSMINSYAEGNLAFGKNRVFVQSLYSGGIRLPDTTIVLSHLTTYSHGLVVFDYAMNVIDGKHYATSSPQTDPGPISLVDSTLYLCMRLGSDHATFGDTTVYADGPWAYMVKYVDPAFMTPHVGPEPVHITETDIPALQVFPNPASDYITVRPVDEPILEVSAISLYGTVHPLPHSNGRIDVRQLPSGIYILSITTPGNIHNERFIRR